MDTTRLTMAETRALVCHETCERYGLDYEEWQAFCLNNGYEPDTNPFEVLGAEEMMKRRSEMEPDDSWETWLRSEKYAPVWRQYFERCGLDYETEAEKLIAFFDREER